jgi:hypothetical protein
VLAAGAAFRLDQDPALGDVNRATLPHKEIFAAIEPGARLLLDDGKLVLRVTACTGDVIDTRVEVGGTLSNHKGLNVPDVVLPMAALTEKDRRDLAFALEQGRRLDRALLRTAARGRGRGATPDRGQGGPPRQDRESRPRSSGSTASLNSPTR